MADTDLILPDNISSSEQALLRYVHQQHPELRSRHDLLLEVLYQQLPEKQKADIVDGHIVIHNCPAMPPHDTVNAMLRELLHHFMKIHPHIGAVFGPMTLVAIPPITPNDDPKAREPDLFWVKEEELGLLTGAKFTGHPTLIIEILASDTKERERDLITKVAEYAQLGVSEYWILDLWENETKFGNLSDSSYTWQGWPHGADPRIDSRTILGFYIQKSWVTLVNGELPSVQQIDPYVTGLKDQLVQARRQKEAERREKEKYKQILRKNGLLSDDADE